MTADTYSVLTVTKDSKLSAQIGALLIPPMFDMDVVTDWNEARRRCAERVYNIVIIDYADGDGADLATDISTQASTILLLTPPALFDQISYRVESFGILTITSPFDTFYFYNMIKIAIAVQYKVQIISSQTVKLKNKMEEIRLVSRAKMLVMQYMSKTEEEAHHYIEKEAMNNGLKKTDVALQIVKQYG